jgi:uncharacterized protein
VETIDSKSTPADAAPRRMTLKWAFFGAAGLRAGWKALLFVAIMVAFYLASQPLLDRIAPRPADGLLSLRVQLIRRSVYALLVLVAVWIMARIERRPMRSYGYADASGPTHVLGGIVWGFAAMSALVGALWLRGYLVFDGLSLEGLSAGIYAAGTFVVCLLVGLMEESQLRGYLQFTLARALGFWWAALILSAAFGLGHIHNKGENLLGVVSIAASGLLFCMSLWYTKSLYWASDFMPPGIGRRSSFTATAAIL